MAEISLYRKYRPHNFKNLVGQDHVRTTLLNAAKKDLISHAYLFCGPRGTGKTSTARLVAKVLNCLNLAENFEPCNECEICVAISEGRLIDIIEIDAASNRGIDEMRDLKDKINFAPTSAKTKVYIIDEVHMLTKEAFNALLKTLEEPPPHAYFILATTEVHKIPETIISRCQRFDFKRISDKTIMTRLSYIAQLEKIEVGEGAIELIARYVDGGMRDAIGLLEQLTLDGKLDYENVRCVLGVSDHQSVVRLYDALIQKNMSGALNEVQSVHSQGHDLQQFIKSFLEYLREQMLTSTAQKEANGEMSWFVKAIDAFQDANKQLRLTVIPQLPLEVAIITLCSDFTEAKQPQIVATKAEKAKSEDMRGLKTIPEEKVEEPKSALPPEVTSSVTPPAIPSNTGSNLTLDEIKEQMPRVLEHILQPSTRRSFQTSNPVSYDGVLLTVEFSTAFHMEKVMTAEMLSDVEQAFNQVFNTHVKIKGTLRKVALKPAIEDVLPPKEIPLKSEDTKKQQDMANAALNIFGGEIIE